ncbi:MAG: hypothetical protein PHS60_06355 [Zavarzinia sp.]|nr:hypothetical protein [Zavarzinia sp.]
MGFDHNTTEFVLHCRDQGVDFAETLTLCHQNPRLGRDEPAASLDRVGRNGIPVDTLHADYVESLLRHLDAVHIASLDDAWPRQAEHAQLEWQGRKTGGKARRMPPPPRRAADAPGIEPSLEYGPKFTFFKPFG